MAPYPTDSSFPSRGEKYWFRSVILASIGYGINSTLFLVCANLLISRITSSKNPAQSTSRDTNQRRDVLSLIYIIFMFVCCTISITVECVTGEKAYVDLPSFDPHGPAKYLFDETFIHVAVLRAGYISFFLCFLGASAVMMWRCFIIYKYSLYGVIVWKRTRTPKWALWMILPGILAIASVGVGMIWLLQAIAPLWLPKSIRLMKWPVIWGSICVIFEWMQTGMIAVRLLIHRAYVRGIMGKKYSAVYTRLVVILVESLAIMSVFDVFFLIAYAVESPTMVMMPYILTQVQVIAPLLVMYRVINGLAWPPHMGQSPEPGDSPIVTVVEEDDPSSSDRLA